MVKHIIVLGTRDQVFYEILRKKIHVNILTFELFEDPIDAARVDTDDIVA